MHECHNFNFGVDVFLCMIGTVFHELSLHVVMVTLLPSGLVQWAVLALCIYAFGSRRITSVLCRKALPQSFIGLFILSSKSPCRSLCCTHRVWQSMCLSFPRPCRAHTPIAAAESVQTRAGCLMPRSVIHERCPRAIPAARTTPWNSASPELSATQACVATHVLIVCFPTTKHLPEVDLRVRTQPAWSVSLYKPMCDAFW